MPLFRRGEPASTLDLLVVGLGNPGREYERDRHNVGFMVVDELARRHGGTFKGKFSGHLAEVRVAEGRLALLKPETYMNDSGRSVQPAAAFYKAPLENLLVVHDEVDLELGRLQARLGGGLAGHNGLRSIAGRLGSPDFLRLRVGVGRPGRGRSPRRRRLRAGPVRARGRRGCGRRSRGRRCGVARRGRSRRDAAPLQLTLAQTRLERPIAAVASPWTKPWRSRLAEHAGLRSPAQRWHTPVTPRPLACLQGHGSGPRGGWGQPRLGRALR